MLIKNRAKLQLILCIQFILYLNNCYSYWFQITDKQDSFLFEIILTDMKIFPRTN